MRRRTQTNTHTYSVPMKSYYNVSLLGSVSGEGASVRLHVLPKHSSPCREECHPVSVNYFCDRFIFCFNRVLFLLFLNDTVRNLRGGGENRFISTLDTDLLLAVM